MVARSSLLLVVSLLATSVAAGNPNLVKRQDVAAETTATEAPAAEDPSSESMHETPAEETPAASTSAAETPAADPTPAASTSAAPARTTPETEYKRPFTDKWTLAANYQADSFYSEWEWETMDDPTNGRVNYVNADAARELGLAWTNGTVFGMAGDQYNVVAPEARGRDSIRITTKEAWTDFLVVFDFLHMPSGCGTWPAFWTLGVGKEWPAAGEIDIIEVNNIYTKNLMSVHTGFKDNCKVPLNMSDFEEWKTEGSRQKNPLCDGTAGCNYESLDVKSGGAPINEEGGGYYIARRDVRGVSMWHWPRSSGKIPDSILNPTDDLDEKSLGVKIAEFPVQAECANLDELLLAQKLIINLTFCGGWGGPSFDNGVCGRQTKMTCVDYVNQHPEAFAEAYWLINGVRVYTPGK